jgi:colicin import membrane protein
MIPGGDVADARVIKSSGNSVFDSRAEIALKRASPLPVPDNPRIFAKMREIRLTFAPN